MSKKIVVLVALLGVALAGVANAGTLITGDITSDTTWTKANSPYHIQGGIFVNPGFSLTIEAGVVVASFRSDTPNMQGSLCVSRGAQLFVNGTATEPVIFTSAEDVATWAGSVVTRDGTPRAGYPDGYVNAITTMGDPKTGTWRAVCNEWGSIAICGDGYISASDNKNGARTWVDSDMTVYTNSKCPNALNKCRMEGLSAPAGDTRVLYGGDNDNDDSGSISYLSLRYGGFVLDLNDELNGFSLGGVGRSTDIHHVEVMNGVDDGIEIWGGTVNISHVSIWNIGDDSLDCDQGWRGSASYGLIVQGYSLPNGYQGGGTGDNCIEIDGAENADAQPVTTVRIKNFTVVGQPVAGDGGTAWRDNARVQYDRCVWMDLGDQLVLFDNHDGDGGNGYDCDGFYPSNSSTKLKNNDPLDNTMNWYQHWTTSYNEWKTMTGSGGAAWDYAWMSDPQSCSINFTDLYEDYMSIDPDGSLCQITNSVFNAPSHYSMYDELSALPGSNNIGNVKTTLSPIKKLTRGSNVTVGTDSKVMQPVVYIDPMPANDAVTKGAGAFSTGNWMVGWTAACAFGMTSGSADLNADGNVDLEDLAVLADQWLN